MTFDPSKRAPSLGENSVVIGLGANMGDARATLSGAVFALEDALGPVVRVSALYQTAPIGPNQPDFLNAAVLVRWSGELLQMLGVLQDTEAKYGRVRDERWGPRTLDLDLLWACDKVVTTDRLQVPHPRLLERAFALQPLLDVIPEALDPRTHLPLAAALTGVGGQRIVRIDESGWQKALPAQ